MSIGYPSQQQQQQQYHPHQQPPKQQTNPQLNNQQSNSSIQSNISNSVNNTSQLSNGPPPPYSKSLPTTATDITDISSLSTNSSTSSYQQQQQQYPQSHSNSNSNPNQPHDQNDLVTAAQALTQLTRSNTPPSDVDTIVTRDSDELSITTTSSQFENNNNNQLPSLSQQFSNQHQKHPIVSTVNMVAKHPIVMNAVKYYESQKRNYPSFNYAAGIVEAAAIPVVNKIEDNLNTRHQQTRLPSFASLESNTLNNNNSHYNSSSNELTPVVSFDNKQKKRRLSSSSSSSISSSTINTSYDTKKRLQFCIHILKAANTNINSKINFLQRKINETEIAVKEERFKLQYQKSNEEPNSINNQVTQKTQTEIIGTVKKIIHLISNFRPSTLGGTTTTAATTNTANASTTTTQESSEFGLSRIPTNISFLQDYELKNTIRDIILHLPLSLQQQESTDSGNSNDKIFVFAKESLDMITKLTNVFSEQLIKVESWVNGEEQLQQQQQQQQTLNTVDEKDYEMKDSSNNSNDTLNSRCSSEEPDGLTSATKRMRINELIDN
ncbi:OPI1 [Candida pseudojiufengensis]|uniref:OPI1 n=1 Tax=Candida pseudojiufengensis TaxID=497109 RepID=UPI002224CEC8|nr:OPI1 [Candida pseudojiufengensis]KAI5963282.1 OPI1 [Candida pseudojiufengensis]